MSADDAVNPHARPQFQWRLEDAPCDFCGARDADTLLESADRIHRSAQRFRLVACRRCGLARTNPRPTTDSLALAYQAAHEPPPALRTKDLLPGALTRWALDNYRGYSFARRSGAAVRSLLWPVGALVLRGRRAGGYLPLVAGGRLLDFGCGKGSYAARMAAAGWHTEGLDLDPQTVADAARAGLTVHLGTLPGVDLPKESFDAVTMWHALEHVPSPMATLKAARELLRPGGAMLVSAPRLDSLPARWFGSAWHPLGLPLHLTHFTRATLRRHVEAAGFRVERISGVGRPGFLRRSFALLAEDTGRPLCRRLSRSRVAVGLMSWLSLAARRAQQMICLARRTGVH